MSPTMDFEVIEGVKMVPGTVRIVDVEGTMNVRHQSGGQSDVVLVPQPTNDPDDPLNWSRFRKEYHFWLLWFWGFIAAVSVNWSGPVWTQWTIDLHTTYNQLNISAALCYLFLGIGCVLLQPIAMKIGRRPVYIMGTLFNICGCIIGGFQTTVKENFGVNILTAIGAAPVDSLVEISTTDIFFTHERGTRLSLLIFTIYAGSYLGPVAAGYISESQGWRWCFWYLVIFFGVILALQLLTMEESTFRRPAQPAEIAGDEVILEHEHDHDHSAFGLDQKAFDAANTLKNNNPAASHYIHTTSGNTTVAAQASPPPPTKPAKSYLQRMALFNTSQNDPRAPWLIATRPFSLITLPAIIWAGVVYGVQIMWLSLLATTQSEIFGSPPYNFSIVNVGNTNFAAFIGGIFGMLWGGYVSDWCTLFLSRRNGGIMEPEFRLWTMLVPAIINTAGLLMYGVGASYGVHWILPAGFGTAFIAFGIGSGGAIAITYAVDCYPRIASESMVLMLFARNLIGTGFTFAIQPWLDLDGLQNTSIIMAMICFAANLSFLGMVWKGKSLREWTARRYLQLAEQGTTVLHAV